MQQKIMSEKQEEHEMTTVKIDWHFLGKIKELGNNGQCLPFETKCDHKGHEIVQPLSGIYVWLLPEKNKKTIFYVGKSNDIWKRLETEITGFLGGAWHCYEMPEENFTEFVLKTCYDVNNHEELPGSCYNGVQSKHYSPNKQQLGCISALLDEKRMDWAKKMLQIMEIAVAIPRPETMLVKLEEIESAIPRSETMLVKLEEIESAIILGLRKQFRNKPGLNIMKNPIPNHIENLWFGGISRRPVSVNKLSHAGPGIREIPPEILMIKNCADWS
jgi:hypothetical protein